MRRIGINTAVVADHLPRIGPVKCRLPNHGVFVLMSEGDDHLVNSIFWNGWEAYEPETVPFFCRLAMKARCVADIGAHIGFYSLLAASTNRNATVLAFEPLQQAYNRLLKNVKANRLSNVNCYNLAVGDTNGTGQLFHVAKGGIPSNSSLSDRFLKRGNEEYSAQNIDVVTFDDFVRAQQIPRVDLIKLDTEGTEHLALKGMKKTLQEHRPTIFCEVLKGMGNEEYLEACLRPLGYSYYWLSAKGPDRVSKIEGRSTEWNYIFTVEKLEDLK